MNQQQSLPPSATHARLLAELQELARARGLAAAMRALFRQQVEAGFVLFDPAAADALVERRFAAEGALPPLRLQWNPQRELRLDPQLLIERGVIAADVDQSLLVHRDERGRGCFLCRHNIALQAPAEVIYPLELAGEPYFLGCNFAPITDNHFTVIVEQHRPQRYHAGILRAGFALAVATEGQFRVLYNDRVGASILGHEHQHATDVRLPLEAVPAAPLLHQGAGLRIAQPTYYLPVWLVEGERLEAVLQAGDRLIQAWLQLDPVHHSLNLLQSYDPAPGTFRLYVVPRDRRRLTAPGRQAAMGSFETAGLVVFSHPEERALFDTVDAASAPQLLASIAPALPPAQALERAMLDF